MNEQRGSPLEVGSYCAVFELHFTLAHDGSEQTEHYSGGNITSAGWQVILCDPMWHVSSRSGEASCELLYSVYLYLYR